MASLKLRDFASEPRLSEIDSAWRFGRGPTGGNISVWKCSGVGTLVRGRNTAVEPSSSCKTSPHAGSIGSTTSPNRSPSNQTCSMNRADKLYLVIESVKRDTRHTWSSTAHAPVDGAEDSAMF